MDSPLGKVEEAIGSLLGQVEKATGSFGERRGGFAKDTKWDDVQYEMVQLKNILKEIQPFVRDASNNRSCSGDMSSAWSALDDVIRDGIDLFRAKLHRFADPGEQSKVGRLVNSIYNFPIKRCFLYRICNEVKDINKRLNQILKDEDLCGLRRLSEEPSSSEVNRKSPREDRHTSSYNYEGKLVGRGGDEEIVIKWLLEESNQGASGVAIVGMGGVGKTALAKTIFDNGTVKKTFGPRSWVCVAEKAEPLDLFNMILEEFGETGTPDDHIDLIFSKLRNHLENKKFLLVLDDVWDHGWWDELRSLLKCCGSGSKVLITTTQTEFAEAMGFAHSHELKCLSEEQSWQLFVNRALQQGESEEDLDGAVEDVGRKIVEKCGGLPLALNVAGCLLRQKEKKKSVWQEVLSRPLWNWEGQQNKLVFSTIDLSFRSISSQLRQCLLYSCLYPKNFKMEKADLVRFWVAEGFISKENGAEIEVTAESCLDDLVRRSLIQKTDDGCYMLHYLVHDFCYMRLKDHMFINQLENESICHARYVSPIGGECYSEAPRRHDKLGLLRRGVDCLSAYDFSSSKYLRVLDLRRGKFQKLPESIGDLTQLKYINLSWTCILELPESIIKLQELQTLDLRFTSIRKLPSEISKLSALRHLDIVETKQLVYLPRDIGNLKSLQTLSKFVVGCNSTSDEVGSSLSELRELDNLRGSLRIEHLERVKSSKEVDHAELKRKKNLQKLQLCCDRKSRNELNEALMKEVEQVYEQMEPPTTIESIGIDSYPGTKCPSWIGSSNYSCLRDIVLIDCNFLESLPNLGFLPNLESLDIWVASMVEVFDTTFDHVCGHVAFPKLETLHLQHMRSLKEWKFDSNVVNMPCLQKLKIRSCPKLRAIPILSTLTDLSVHWMDEWEGWAMEKERNMPHLKSMEVVSCKNLKLLPDCPELQKLLVDSCDELVELPRLSSVLERATIKNCRLVSCPMVATPELKGLRHLEIVGCPKLEYLLQWLQAGEMETLERLNLRNLPQLSSLPMMLSDGMRGLEELDLGPDLGAVQVEGLLDRLELTNLRRLTLSWIHDMGVNCFKSRIRDMVRLKELVIVDCPMSTLLSIIDVLRDLCPPKLQFLQLASSGFSLRRPWYLLQYHISMTCEFVIDSMEMSDKLGELMVQLSSQVRCLQVKRLAGLDSLPTWIQQLQQLEELTVHGSPHLTRLPDWLNKLSQLKRLHLLWLPELVEIPPAAIENLDQLHFLQIVSCSKLSFLPDELCRRFTRPGSLQITGSTLLAERHKGSTAIQDL